MLVSAEGISLYFLKDFFFLMQYLSHIEKYKAKMQKNLIYPVLRNKALPAHLILKSEGMLFCHHYLCSFPFTNMRKLTVIIWEKIKLHTT